MAVVGRAEVKIVADARGFSRQAERAVNRQLRNVDVDADPIRNGIAQGLTGATVQRAVTRSGGNAAVGWLNQFGRVLQGGVSTRAAGALGGAVLAAIVPVMTVVGTLAAGTLVTAFGAGIAGLGIAFAAQSQEVRNEFAGVFRDLGNQMRVLARPFEKTLLDVAQVIADVFGPFRVALRPAFEELAPVISQFAEDVGDAFVQLAPTIQPITDAFIHILEDLGPELRDDIFPGLARAITNMSEAIEGSDNFVQLIGWLFGLVEGAFNLFAVFTRLGNWVTDNSETFQPLIDAIGDLLTFSTPLVDEVVRLIDNLLTATPVVAVFTTVARALLLPLEILVAFLVDVVKWINEFIEAMNGAENRVSEQIDALKGFFQDFGRVASNLWDDITSGARQMTSSTVGFFRRLGERAADAWRTIRRGANNVVDFFQRLPGRIGRAVRGAFDGLWQAFKSAVNNIIRAWNGLSFPSLTVGGQDPLGPFGPSIPVTTIGGWNLPNIPYLQSGGLIAEAGMARVGEAGEETVFLPRGAQVDPRPVDQVVAQSERLPDEFEATATIDLGHDIQRAVNLTFRRVATNARAGQRRTAAMA